MPEIRYGIVEKASYTVPGDERSRTNPGHGYPEHTVEYEKFTDIGDEIQLRVWIENNKDRYRKARLIQFVDMEANIYTTMTLKIKE